MEKEDNTAKPIVEEEKKAGGAPHSSKKVKLEALVSDEIRDKWTEEQNQLKTQLKEVDDFDAAGAGGLLDPTSPETLESTLKLIGAVDIGYSKNDDRKAVACLLVLEYPSMKVLYEDHHHEI